MSAVRGGHNPPTSADLSPTTVITTPNTATTSAAATVRVESVPVTWDRLMTRLGSPGRFQTIVFVMLASNYIAVAFNHLFPVIYSQKPSAVYCVPDQFDLTKHGKIKKTHHEFVEYTCPTAADHRSNNDTLERACRSSLSSGFVYEFPQDGQFSIASEWDLICSREALVRWATTFYFCGVMIGGLLFGHLSDHYGRRLTLLICMLGEALLGVSIYFIHSYALFVVVKIVQGMLLQGLQSTSYVLMIEYFHSRHRTLVGTIAEDFWALGVILLALLGFWLRNWRYIQLACSLLSLLGVLYFFVLEESLRWLLTRGDTQQALAVARRIIKFNGQYNYTEIESIILDDGASKPSNMPRNGATSNNNVSRQESTDNGHLTPPLTTPIICLKNKFKQQRQYHLFDLFRTPVLRFRTVTMCFIWFATSSVYYGLSFQMIDLPISVYTSLLIAGITEAIAYTGSTLILYRFGRRRPLCAYFAVAGITCIAAGFISSDKAAVAWRITLCLIGRMGAAGALSVIFMYATELFPTVVRNVAYGFCSSIFRLGGVVAPQIISLGVSLFAELPFIIFGLFALIAAVAAILLPETSGRPMPDELSDIEPSIIMHATTAVELRDSMPNDNKIIQVDNDSPSSPASSVMTNDYRFSNETPSPIERRNSSGIRNDNYYSTVN